jgi:hypothetical protein
VQAESEPAVIPWGALVLAIPLTALGFFALATGILPPLLLGFLVLVFARSALRSLA